jgi:hypothetical protein
MSSFDYDILDQTLTTSAAIRILRSPNAALVLSFLYKQFKQSYQLPVIPYVQLLERLDAYIETVNEELPDRERYGGSAKEYLKGWANDYGLVKIYAQGSEAEEVVELTRDAERVLSWIEELERRPFVGTESRFLTIFNLLEEIVARSTTNPEVRLKQLERDRDAIQQEIDEITRTGQVKQFSTTQIKDWFLQAEDTARMMQRDFTLVRDNFKALARQVQEEQLRPDARKGSLVAAVLNAEDQLKESDEGRSFYAFWQFLLNPERQETLGELLDVVHKLPDVKDVMPGRSVLGNLVSNLLRYGGEIARSNQRLIEQIRRVLDERMVAETRRVRQLVDEIKSSAFELRDTPPPSDGFLEIEGLPEVRLPMERTLWEPSSTLVLNDAPLIVAKPGRMDFAGLLRQMHIDETTLRRQVDALLLSRTEVSLAEILEHYPVEYGLTELLGYFSIAAQDSGAQIDREHAQEVTIRSKQQEDEFVLTLSVPRVVFRKVHID